MSKIDFSLFKASGIMCLGTVHSTGSETTPPYALQSSRFSSELPSVEDDADVWRYASLELHARNDDDEGQWLIQQVIASA